MNKQTANPATSEQQDAAGDASTPQVPPAEREATRLPQHPSHDETSTASEPPAIQQPGEGRAEDDKLPKSTETD